MRKFFILVFILSLSAGSCNARIFKRNAPRKADRALFGKSLSKKKEVKIKEPRSVTKAKKKQEANHKKLDKDYAKDVKRSQKRTIDIQSPEVQARMKQNQKDTDIRDKGKKKYILTGTKKAGKKYK